MMISCFYHHLLVPLLFFLSSFELGLARLTHKWCISMFKCLVPLISFRPRARPCWVGYLIFFRTLEWCIFRTSLPNTVSLQLHARRCYARYILACARIVLQCTNKRLFNSFWNFIDNECLPTNQV